MQLSMENGFSMQKLSPEADRVSVVVTTFASISYHIEVLMEYYIATFTACSTNVNVRKLILLGAT